MKKRLYNLLPIVLTILILSGCYSDAEIEEIRATAYTDGYDAGMVSGYSSGFDKGYELGFEDGFAADRNETDEDRAAARNAARAERYAGMNGDEAAELNAMDDFTVYVGALDELTHMSKDCGGMIYYIAMTYEDAKASGYELCESCLRNSSK